MAEAIDGLDEPNTQAWRLFHRLATRFAVDAQLVPEIWRFFTADLAEQDYDALFDRLSLIYEIVMPTQTKD